MNNKTIVAIYIDSNITEGNGLTKAKNTMERNSELTIGHLTSQPNNPIYTR